MGTGLIHVFSLYVCCLLSPVCLRFMALSRQCGRSTKPIATGPGSIKAGEYRITRGICFVAKALRVGIGRAGCPFGFGGVFWYD